MGQEFDLQLFNIYFQMGKKIEGQQEPVNSPNKCAICMEKNAYVSINCTHKFCMHCITKWTNRNNSCPLCRANIREIKHGKKIKKVTQRTRPTTQNSSVGQNSRMRITWKPIILIGIPYFNYYYFVNSFVPQTQA